MRSAPSPDLVGRRLPRGAAVAAALLSLAALGGCGTEEVLCFDDRSCLSGQRCEIGEEGGRGVCVACAATETPYNGIDDDCNGRTRDVDLDGDGQNSDQSPFEPGLDCNDSDPLTRSGGNEICGDGADNDCDGVVDERDCADMAAPTVRIVSPVEGETIAGTVPVRIQLDDDVGVVELVVKANNAVIGQVMLEPQATRIHEVLLETVSLPEGSIVLRAEATDLKGQRGAEELNVTIDNATPPNVLFGNPIADNYYGGFMTVTATVTDPSGVAEVQVELDGTLTATLTSPPWTARIETSSLADGAHTISLRCVDGNGTEGRRTVSFFVDNTPPEVGFDRPTNGQVVSGVFEVVVTATDAAGLGSLTAGPARGVSPLSFPVNTELGPNGVYTLTATAVDAAVVDDGARGGNMGTAVVSYTVDNVDPSPVVTWVTPQPNDGILGETDLEVSVVSLVGNTIVSVEYEVEGVLVESIGTAPYRVSHDFSLVTTGTVSVVATAHDDLGNSGSATAVLRVVGLPNFRSAQQAELPGNIGIASGFAVGDVNADGINDVVVGAADLTVFTGTITAGGEWRAVSAVANTSQSLVDVRLSDIDGDGDLDVIGAANAGLQIYEGFGDGTFGMPQIIPFAQNGIDAFEIGDLDGDLDDDIVVVGGSTPGLVGYVYISDGQGGFSFGQNLGGDSGASDVALADIDGDLDLDLIISRDVASILTIFFNGSVANFGAGQDSPTAGPAYSLAVADMTGEGRLDVVLDLGVGFQTLPVLSLSPFSIVSGVSASLGNVNGLATGDIVGNNLTDVVAALPSAHGAVVVRNGAGGATGFARDETYVVANQFEEPKLIDLDGDGLLDLVGLSPTNNSFVWAKNIGAGKFLAAITVPAPVVTDSNNDRVVLSPAGLDIGNVIGGAADDLVVTFEGVSSSAIPPQLALYENDGAGVSLAGAVALTPSIDPPTVVSVGGRAPTNYEYIAVATNDEVSTMDPQPTLTFIQPNPPNLLSVDLLIGNPTDVAFGDVDNDTVDEFIIALDPSGGATDGTLVLETGTFASVAGGRFNFGQGASSIAVGNLDSDPLGTLDYAVANTVSENITVQLWNGTGFSTTLYNAPTGLGDITTGLVNNDSRVDIVGLAAQGGVFVMEGDANFGFRTPVTYPAGRNSIRINGGDFNGDGLFDIVTMNDADQAFLLLARPQGGFFPATRYDVGAGIVDFKAVDFDGDGRRDIVSIHDGYDSILLIFNNADTL